MDINKIQSTNPGIPKASSTETNQRKEVPVLTKNEKKYFEKLFPNDVKQIRAHKIYTEHGELHNLSNTGTIVDKKG